MRLWDADIGDEGVRAFCQFMLDTGNTSIQLVEMMNCGIGVLGCEFISRIFDKERANKISILTLDYNTFGNEGLQQLMENLKDSKSLTYLSLAYCNIDQNGVKSFADYLSATQSLEKLILQGNPLKNAGMTQLINIIFDNTSLEEINLNNILFGNSPETMQSLVSLMKNNLTLLAYSLKFNFITDQGKLKSKLNKFFIFLDFEILLREGLKAEGCKHIYQFLIDEKISKPLFDEYYKMMKSRKKPKKKGKGGKKKK